MDYLLDCETLGTESKSIVLSIALLAFTEADANTPFLDLVNRARFWKLDIKNQYKLGRTADQKTIDWWNSSKVSQPARVQSFKPRITDLNPEEVLGDIVQLVHKEEDTFWSRGCMDQLWLESLVRTYEFEDKNGEQIIPDHAHRDIRTALAVQGKSNNHQGKPTGFIVHDPRHDCAMDVLTLLRTAA
jgi:3' exoribonuclease, RNase T-like